MSWVAADAMFQTFFGVTVGWFVWAAIHDTCHWLMARVLGVLGKTWVMRPFPHYDRDEQRWYLGRTFWEFGDHVPPKKLAAVALAPRIASTVGGALTLAAVAGGWPVWATVILFMGLLEMLGNGWHVAQGDDMRVAAQSLGWPMVAVWSLVLPALALYVGALILAAS